jgi:molybdopterin molybdotransferase
MGAPPDYGDALVAALSAARPLGRSESVTLDQAAGRVLDESIIADRDLPPFDRAQMDGYAARYEDLLSGRPLPVMGRIAAGTAAAIRIPPGGCVAIATGAPLPLEVDTVVQHELTDRGEPMRLKMPAAEAAQKLRRGQSVHPRGVDAHRGDVIVAPGSVLGPQHLGLAATVGQVRLRVRARPRALILTSGDEVVAPERVPAPHQIRNSNTVMINELLRRFGAEPVRHEHLQDDRDMTTAAVGRALSESDLVVTVGGVSAGERDFFPTAFEAHSVRMAVNGASLQPGGPIMVGHAERGQVVVGLPGNPVSVLACACLFLWPLVRRLLDLSADLPWRKAQLAEAIVPNTERRAFRPAILLDDGRVRVPSWAGSGDLVHTSTTHGLLELPIQSEPVEAGATLRLLPWPRER